MSLAATGDDIVDACVASNPIFDETCYACWLQGLTLQQALKRVRSTAPMQFRRPRAAAGDFEKQLTQLYVSDQYRNFDILEHYIAQPDLLPHQNLVACPRDKSAMVVDKYFTLDEVVAREIVGKQRLTKSRKDLDEISLATNTNLKSVTRQFDNLKRIYSQSEEAAGNVQTFIRDRFHLTAELARRYACLVFLVSCGFALGAKKRMTKVSCNGLELCAALTMACLVTDLETFTACCRDETAVHLSRTATLSNAGDDSPAGASATAGLREESALVLAGVLPLGESSEQAWRAVWRAVRCVPNTEGVDKQLQVSLSRVRVLVSQHGLDLGIAHIRAGLSASVAEALQGAQQGRLRPVVREVVKDLVNIGSQLSQTREYRDFFEDVLTKVGEPLEDAGLAPDQINAFLLACGAFLDFLSSVDDGGGGGNLLRDRRSSSVSERVPTTSSLTAESRIPSQVMMTTNSDLRSHWVRYVTCCRLCLMQLLEA